MSPSRACPPVALLTAVLVLSCGSSSWHESVAGTDAGPDGTSGGGAGGVAGGGAGGSGAAAGAGAGGSAGVAGGSGIGGAGGSAGIAGGGGIGGAGGSAGVAGAGGIAGTAGAGGGAGSAGASGAAGTAGTAGIGGAAGTAGQSGAAGEAGAAGAGGDPGPVSLRIAAANLTSGNYQSYDPGHGIRILQGLDPDITLIQELNYGDNSLATMAAFVTTTFGPDFHYCRESGQLPNGIISRYPILESGEWDDPHADNRDFVWARIDLPGQRELWTISVHFLTEAPSTRYYEANALLEYLEANLPADALVVLGGDFNTGTREEPCVTALASRFLMTAPWPSDQASNSMTSANRSKPLDWLVVGSDVQAMEVPVQIGNNSFPSGLVFDSRVYEPLEDLPEVLETDSGATGMQHMAVVRQFVIP